MCEHEKELELEHHVSNGFSTVCLSVETLWLDEPPAVKTSKDNIRPVIIANYLV